MMAARSAECRINPSLLCKVAYSVEPNAASQANGYILAGLRFLGMRFFSNELIAKLHGKVMPVWRFLKNTRLTPAFPAKPEVLQLPRLYNTELHSSPIECNLEL
jgi:hypothetical protein